MSEGPHGRKGPAGFGHLPVMVDRVVELVAPVPPGLFVDATVGGGGHAAAVLAAAPHLRLLGLDQDAVALAAAAERLGPFGDRVALRHVRFDRLGEAVDALSRTEAIEGVRMPTTTDTTDTTTTDTTETTTGGTTETVSAVLFDLGVSSPQLDRPERGFSYRHDGPLDMRMDQRAARTADEVVNRWSEAELADVLRRHGDERFAARIARAIVAARPLTGTAQLAEVVRDAIPAATRRHGGHPAKRTFQALRIAVNDELEVLPAALDEAVARLAPGGRCVVLSYHSGEDRIVKARFRHHATGGWAGPSHLPRPPEVQPTVRLLKRGSWTPDPAELAANPRSQSARLRAVEKLASAPRSARRSES